MREWDDYKRDPDPELDRYSVYDPETEEWDSVFNVSRWRRWRRFIEFDFDHHLRAPLYRLRQEIYRHFRRCAWCGHIGCKYWFSNTCSDECSHALYLKNRAEFDKREHDLTSATN